MRSHPELRVDVSDICLDIDEVAIYRHGGAYQAVSFVKDGRFFEEIVVDLDEYPAVKAVVARAADVENIRWSPRPAAGDPNT